MKKYVYLFFILFFSFMNCCFVFSQPDEERTYDAAYLFETGYFPVPIPSVIPVKKETLEDIPAKELWDAPWIREGEEEPKAVKTHKTTLDEMETEGVESVPVLPVPGGGEPDATAASGASKGFYRLRIGDQFLIKIYGEDATLRRVTIDPNGKINYLFVHGIEAQGKTAHEVRQQLENELGGYYRDPIVMMTPIEFVGDFYTILGELVSPGLKELKGNMTVLDAIAEAGGFETRVFNEQTVDLIDLKHSFLSREGECVDVDFQKLVDGDLSQDRLLQTGDFIFIAPGGQQEVYVLGEVFKPANIEYFGRITLVQAVAQAGGTGKKSSSRVVVLRGSLTDPTRYLIDYNRIVKGCCPDFPLEPGDIVYVPPRQFQNLREVAYFAIRDFVGELSTQAATSAFISIVPDARGRVSSPSSSIDFSSSTGTP